MSVIRRFVIAPSLVRLIRKERGGSRVTEGYFAPQGGRTSLVRIEGQNCHLVLISSGADGVAKEERTEVPRAHGEALLDVCSGKAAYDRTSLPVGAHEIVVDRYVTPGGLDLVSITFNDEAASKSFAKPSWLGAEVSTEAAYDRHAIALQGAPKAAEATLSNAALEALLDVLEPRFGLGRPAAPAAPATVKPAPAPAAVEAVAKPPEPAAHAAVQDEAPAVVPEKPPEAANTSAPPSEDAAAPQPFASAPAAADTGDGKPEAGKIESSKTDSGKPDEGDSRIDDVIESLSQALGAAIQQPREPVKDGDLDSSFERWTVRPRRTQQ